ncbi:MAG: hydrogenase maturation nickel metallochaperone HypA [Campylobacterales bacterium]
MHEYSIVDSLLQLVDQHARENLAKRVTRIEIKVGVLSGVEPELLERAFEVFKEGTVAEGAEFVIKIQPVVVECQRCGAQQELPRESSFRCPSCGAPELKIIDGEEMFLTSLELEVEDSESEGG